MSFSVFMQASLNNLLRNAVNISAVTGNTETLNKLAKLLYQHFCLPAQHLLPAYRESFQQTVKALRLTLAPPLLPLQCKVIKDFQKDLRRIFIPSFPQPLARKTLVKECKNLEHYPLFEHEPLFLGTQQAFESNLAGLIGARQLPDVTALILEELQHYHPLSSALRDLLQWQDLLACGIWHFLRADPQMSHLIAILQQEHTFQRVQHIDDNVQNILSLVRDIHHFTEQALSTTAAEPLPTLTIQEIVAPLRLPEKMPLAALRIPPISSDNAVFEDVEPLSMQPLDDFQLLNTASINPSEFSLLMPNAGQLEIFELGGGVRLELAYIPAGEFLMGSEQGGEDEQPVHVVTLAHAFYMGKYPVTQAQYRAVLGKNPAYWKDDHLPVEQVNWLEANIFCERLSHQLGQAFRLPNEAEWEYSCRAGADSAFYFGETITPTLANYDGGYSYHGSPKGIYRKRTTAVGLFPPNAFGLYDMHGNVWEWTCSEYAPYGMKKETQCLPNLEGLRVLRGGSWFDLPDHLRSAHRNSDETTSRSAYVGFRVLLLI